MIKSPVLWCAAILAGATGKCAAAPGPFTPASLPYTPFTFAKDGRAAWVDFDGDGDVDISLNGIQSSAEIFRIWLKNGNTLTQQTTNIPGARLSPGAHTCLVWADFNRDGKPDLGRQYRGQGCDNNLCDGNKWGDRCEAWRNDGGGNFTTVFSKIGGDYGDLDWTDSNLDGYADISFTGYALMYPGYPTTTYTTTTGSATALNGGGDFPFPLSEGTFAWMDYDRDGQMDFAYTGDQRVTYSYSNSNSELWRRNGTNWDRVPINPVHFYDAEVTWADVDLDGRPDLITLGSNGWDLWRQTATGFVRVPDFLPSSLATVWGDLDNDGDLDCALCSASQTVIWENKGNATFEAGVSLPAQERVSFADWDRDGDLDILTATGAVYINGNNTPARPPAVRRILPRGDSIYLAFQAHPATTFLVQSGPTPAGPWTTQTARPFEMQPGEYVFIDRTPPPARLFYRLAVP